MPRGKRVRRNEREHGQGSIKDQPDGSVRAWRPPQLVGSKTTRPSRLFRGTDARARAESWLKGVEVGAEMPLGQWNELWYTRREATLSPNSRKRYRLYFAMTAAIMGRQLASLSTDDWQVHINLLLFGDQAKPEQERHAYARGTVARARAIWSAALSAAVRARHITANPLLDTLLPRAQEMPPKAWRDDEVLRMMAVARGHHHEAFLHLGLGTGMRLGEMRALEWSDIDFTERQVVVSKSMDGNTGAIGPTKTGKVRVIPLPEELAEILAAHSKRQALGTRLVIGKQDAAYHPSTLRDWLAKVCKLARATPLPPHSLRHTFASAALADSVDLPALSAMLGHANIIITGMIYSHFTTQAERPTAKAISRRFYGAGKEGRGPSAPGSAHFEWPDQEKTARV